MLARAYGMVVRQNVWAKKAGASSRTPQNCGEAPFGVRRLAAAFARSRGKIEIDMSGARELVPAGIQTGSAR
jgi:hypothetical protein